MSLIKTTFFSGIIALVRFATIFISNKVIAIYTGTTGIALIGAFTNFINIVFTFANGAINTGVIKYTAEYEGNEEKLKSLFSTSFKFSLYCSSLVGLLLFTFGPNLSFWLFLTHLYDNPTRVLGISIVLYSLNSLLIAILNGKQQIKDYTIVNSTGSLVSLVLTILLVYYLKTEGALYALVFSQSIIFFVTLYFTLKANWFSLDYFKQVFDIHIIKKLSHYSLMAIITALTVPVSQIILRNLLIAEYGLPTAGIWQGMMRISDSYLMIITTTLATYYLPKLSSIPTDNELKAEIFYGYKLILPFILFCNIIIYVFRMEIINILFTPEFRKMSDLFTYHLLGDFFKIASWILAYIMVAKSMTKIYILSEAGFNLLYVGISFFCVKNIGFIGISIAFFVSYVLYFLTMLILFRKLLFSK